MRGRIIRVGGGVFMGLYRVVLTSTRALAPLRFQFSGDIKRHALDGRVGFFPDFLFSPARRGAARRRGLLASEGSRSAQTHTYIHTLRQGRRTGISGEARMNLYRRTSSSKFS